MTLYGVVLWLCLLYPYMWMVVALHELAHLLVGRWLGMEPYFVHVGRGRLLYAGRVRGVAFSLHAKPNFGMVHAPGRYTGQSAWRIALFFAAGPASDALVLLFLCACIWLIDRGSPLQWTLYWLAIFQTCLLAFNLLPMEFEIGGAKLPNDGKQILRIFTGGTEGWRRRLHERNTLNVQRYDPAFRVEDTWTLRADAQQVALYNQACSASEAGRYDEAVDQLERLLAAVPMHPAEEASILDKMTVAAIFHNNLDLLPRALQWGRRAHALLPGCATLQGSYGALLVQSAYGLVPGEDATANARAGMEMLLPLAAESHTLLDRVVSLYFIALARQLLGDEAAADAALASARELGDDGKMLRDITARVRELRARRLAVADSVDGARIG
jgi:hypothetical protein